MRNTFKQASIYKYLFSFNWLYQHLFQRSINDKKKWNLTNYLRQKNLKKLQEIGHIGRALRVDIVEDISRQDFIENYLKKNKPVVLKGAAKKWECISKWSPDFLNEKYGDDDIPLINASPNLNEEMEYSVKTVKFREVIEGMKRGDNSYYSRFNDLLGNHPELLNDIDKNWFLERTEKIVSGNTFQCFIGGDKTYTHIHSAVQSNFFVQVYGKKNWLLYPPSYNQYLAPLVDGRPYFSTLFHPKEPNFKEFPEMKYLDYFDITLEPGDILYNPPSWWHHVINESMTIGFGFRWASLASTIKSSPIQLFNTITAYNPSVRFAIKSRGNFAKVFGYKKQKN